MLPKAPSTTIHRLVTLLLPLCTSPPLCTPCALVTHAAAPSRQEPSLRTSLVADGTIFLRASMAAGTHEEGSAGSAANALRASYATDMPVFFTAEDHEVIHRTTTL